ncbi:hypothetical protein MMC30_003530 [Trapelia coarctata]|nr:hypothetical protein [Trapelia coarctata]
MAMASSTMSLSTTRNQPQSSHATQTASKHIEAPITDASFSSHKVLTPGAEPQNDGPSSRCSGDLQHLFLRSHNCSGGIKYIDPPSFINHGVIHKIYERFPSSTKRIVDHHDSEPFDHIAEARLEFTDAQHKFLYAYTSLRDATERDEKLQREIIELVALINELNAAANGEGDHGKLISKATAFKLSSIKSTANFRPIDKNASHITAIPIESTDASAHASTRNLHDLTTRVFKLTNDRLKCCAAMESKLLDVQLYGRLKDQTFIELNQLRIKSARNKTTELRDVAIEYRFESEQEMYLARSLKRKREQSDVGESAVPVEETEHVEMRVPGSLGTEHLEIGRPGPAKGTKNVEMEGSGSEDSDDGGVLLAVADGKKEEGGVAGAKKRRRKRKKAGAKWRKPENGGKTLEETRATRVLPHVVDVSMPDAGATDGYLAHVDMDAVSETPLLTRSQPAECAAKRPLPVLPTPTDLECAAAAAAPGPPKPYEHEDEREHQHQDGHQPEREKPETKSKRRRKHLSAALAYEKNFARGVKAREDGLKAKEEEKMREEPKLRGELEMRDNMVLGEIQGVDEEGMLIWGDKASEKPVEGEGNEVPRPAVMRDEVRLWESVAEERGAWAVEEDI